MASRLAVIGAGWAGLAAARARRRARRPGHAVRDGAAPRRPRARRSNAGSDDGARQRPAHPDRRLQRDAAPDAPRRRRPRRRLLRAAAAPVDARGRGPALPPGAADAGLRRGRCSAARGWSWRDRLALLRAAAGWARARLPLRRRPRPSPSWRARLPAAVRARADRAAVRRRAEHAAAEAQRAGLPARAARRAVRRPRGVRPAAAAPRPERPAAAPALRWLEARRRADPARASGRAIEPAAAADRAGGSTARPSTRWCSPPARSKRRAWWRRIDPAWAARAAALRYEPIVTVYARSAGARLPEPMLALRMPTTSRPAQFVFDRGQLGGPAGPARLRRQRRRRLGRARPRRHRGGDAGAGARRAGLAPGADRCEALRTIVEKRATFRCTPRARPAAGVDRARARRGRRLRRRPLPGHARRRGAQRHGCGTMSLLSDGVMLAMKNRRHAKDRRPRPSPSRCWSAPSPCSTCWPRTRTRCR